MPRKGIFESSGQGEPLGISELGMGMSLVFLVFSLRMLWKSSHANKIVHTTNMVLYISMILTAVYLL